MNLEWSQLCFYLSAKSHWSHGTNINYSVSSATGTPLPCFWEYGYFHLNPSYLLLRPCRMYYAQLNEEVRGRDKPGCSSFSGHLKLKNHCLLESGSIRLLPPLFHLSYYQCAQFQLNCSKWVKSGSSRPLNKEASRRMRLQSLYTYVLQ